MQHGIRGAVNIFEKLVLNKKNEEIINEIYSERKKVNIYFKSSGEKLKKNLIERFENEKKDALEMLKREKI